MSTFNLSTLRDGTLLAFETARDRLVVDDPTLSAADLRIDGLGLGDTLLLRLPTASVTLVGPDLGDLGGADLRFADGSRFVRAHSGNGWATSLGGSGGDDLLAGSAAAFALTVVSKADSGALGNRASIDGDISADGRFVVFNSNATNLLDEVTPSDGLFVADLLDGSLTRIAEYGARVALSASGQHVAFRSSASELLVYDLTTGTTLRASSNGESPSLSADGRFVAFDSRATDLVAGDTNGKADVFVKDLRSGTTVRASVDFLGVQANGGSFGASLSADGRLVAFQSDATNLVAGDTNAQVDVFVRNFATGQIALASKGSAGALGDGSSFDAELSASGRFVVFTSVATNLVAGDTNAQADIFVRDLVNGTTTRVSTGAAGVQANGRSSDASISGDGRYVVFTSESSNLVAGDTNTSSDVFVKDLSTGAIARVSVTAAGAEANGTSFQPEISADGSRITFSSLASNLTGDPTSSTQIFTVANPLLARTLTGGAGDDVYLVANAADQVVENASAGTDTVRASVSLALAANVENLELLGAAALAGTGNSLANRITGNAGNNVVDGGTGTDTLSYETAGDGVTVDLSIAVAQDTGGAGVDRLVSIENLVGSAFDDALVGSAAPNLLEGGAGADLLVGGGGSDTYVVDNPGDEIVEDAAPGTDFVRSRIGWTLADNLENLTLTGSANINGTGNALNNSITGNRGANRLDGGAGIDTAGYGTAVSGVNVGLDLAGWQNTLGGGVDRLLNFENLGGSPFNDTLHGNAGDNLLIGGSGLDTVSYARAAGPVSVNLSLASPQATGGAGTDTIAGFETLVGSAFGDTLTASSTIASRVDGGAGDDTLATGAIDNVGNDTLAGGSGADRYLVDTSGAVIVEAAGAGADLVVASVNHTLAANVEDLDLVGNAFSGTGNTLANVIRAGAGNQSLSGGAGNDTLVGGAGIDTLTGGAGNDSYEVEGADVVVEAADGGTSDLVLATASFVLPAEVEALWLSGSADIDGTGNAGANFLLGNAGANRLDGGAGSDTLAGGDGADTFRTASLAGADTLSDFVSGTDRLLFGMAGLPIGDLDSVIDAATATAGSGGFSPFAELVVVGTQVSGALTTASAATAIGSATAMYTPGFAALFAVDNGSSTAVYRFVSSNLDAVVSAGELTLVAMLTTTPGVALGDFVFGV